MSGFLNKTIGDWTPAELQSFLQNVVQLEPSQLPPSFNVKTLTSADAIVAGGVTLTGDPPIVETKAIRDAGIVPGSDQSNAQTVSNATFEKVHFTTHENYNSTLDDPSRDQWINNSDWECPVTGLYIIQAAVDWTSNATGIRRMVVNTSDRPENSGNNQGDANDTPYLYNQIAAYSNELPHMITGFAYIEAGTQLSVFVYQNSGSGLNLRIEENYSSNTRSRYATVSFARVAAGQDIVTPPIV